MCWPASRMLSSSRPRPSPDLPRTWLNAKRPVVIIFRRFTSKFLAVEIFLVAPARYYFFSPKHRQPIHEVRQDPYDAAPASTRELYAGHANRHR